MDLEGRHPNPKLPGWLKTGRRTRGPRAHHQCPTASDDELAAENLPPKKRKLDSAEAIPISERNGKDLCCKMPAAKHHRCNICSRSFSSYQALGGHKAHHNSKDHHKATVADNGTLGVATVHRCTLCYKVFSKGQALGGHRRHCQGPIITENGAKMFSFDLNELPPECSWHCKRRGTLPCICLL